jgi:PEP-CTERM motif
VRGKPGCVLAFLAVGLFCCTSASADSTLHIGTGTGTVCQSGCAGDANLIGTGGTFDTAQVSIGKGAGEQPYESGGRRFHDRSDYDTGYGLYLFKTGIAPGGFVDLSRIPWGTFALGLGIQGDPKLDGTPFIEVGLTTRGRNVTMPEPGSLALLGIGLVSIAGILRRRYLRS